ncbi:hypothetical protein PF005_g30876 [Phytophthora fragariae]|nr:hypothetical protein PF003_g36437 [Phytophthora fragariae]KAE8957585.1 hypothetical protein PR001_g31318 [Phytophthora rubi]KAE8925946.1 hypothetical protein PF009_g23861 [Phytophthora fragariae]KAE9067016.1 hypothetical protein PF006_g30086 [Phytophthora fragariae]KAE9083848.1 hypothetical protein PF007_g21743 [Phytophthora fragariae]
MVDAFTKRRLIVAIFMIEASLMAILPEPVSSSATASQPCLSFISSPGQANKDRPRTLRL